MAVRLPVTRADCPHERPCPHRLCRYHLAEDARGHGAPSCSLDVADVAKVYRESPRDERLPPGVGLSIDDLAFLLGWSVREVREVLATAMTKLHIRTHTF